MRKSVLAAALVALVLVAAGCKVVATPAKGNGWFFTSDGSSGNGSSYFVNGPEDAPVGRGSALLTIDDNYSRQAMETQTHGFALWFGINDLRSVQMDENGTVIDFRQAGTPMDLNAGIETVLIHPLSGLLSAYGIGLAGLRASREQSIEALLSDETMREIEARAWALGNAATEELLDQGVNHDDIALTTWLHLRYEGTDTALPVVLSEPDLMVADFEAQHRQRFGFLSPEKPIVIAAGLNRFVGS